MTYNEMKYLINKNWGNDIKINELNNPKRFEAAGLGVIDASQLEYYGPIGMYYIYSGDWNSKNKKIIKQIVPETNVDVFEEFYTMVKNIKE